MGKISELSLKDIGNLLLMKRFVSGKKFSKLGLQNYSEEEIYKRINVLYYLTFGKEKDITLDSDRKELYEWVMGHTRYDILNDEIRYLIENICTDKDGDIDLFLFNNLNALFGVIYESVEDYIDDNDIPDCNLTKISKDEVIALVKRMLGEIDSSGEWLNIYDSYINDNKIIYLNECSPEEIDRLRKKIGLDDNERLGYSYINLDNDERYILVNYEGNIGDVGNTIHEFIHSIVEKDNSNIPFIFREFPSIFYEFYTLFRLSKMGFSRDEVCKIYSLRLANTKKNIDDTFFIRRYMNIFTENCGILEEHDAELVNCNTDKICEYCIMQNMLYPTLLRDSSAYVIGNFLALCGILGIKSDRISLDDIRKYIDRIDEANPYELFVLLGIPVDELGLVDTKKRKKKLRKKENKDN